MTIAEQIAAIQRIIKDWSEGYIASPDDLGGDEIASLRTVLATLSQHKRAMAVVEAARALAASTSSERNSIDAAVVVLRRLNDLREALAALDAAETEKR